MGFKPLVSKRPKTGGPGKVAVPFPFVSVHKHKGRQHLHLGSVLRSVLKWPARGRVTFSLGTHEDTGTVAVRLRKSSGGSKFNMGKNRAPLIYVPTFGGALHIHKANQIPVRVSEDGLGFAFVLPQPVADDTELGSMHPASAQWDREAAAYREANLKIEIAIAGGEVPDVLLMRACDLELSTRPANCLKNDNIVYVGDLVQKTEAEMLRTPNFARKSLNEVKDVLAPMGLHFGMHVPGWPKTDEGVAALVSQRFGANHVGQTPQEQAWRA